MARDVGCEKAGQRAAESPEITGLEGKSSAPPKRRRKKEAARLAQVKGKAPADGPGALRDRDHPPADLRQDHRNGDDASPVVDPAPGPAPGRKEHRRYDRS